MADQKISDLPSAVAIAGAILPVIQGGSNKSMPASFLATAAQGAKADTAVQPGSLGSAAYQPSSAFATTAQGAKADTAVQSSSLGTAAYSNNGDFATAAQGAKADTAVQPDDLGTAAALDAGDFATAAQGAKADTALQPADAAGFATAAQGAKADTAIQPADIGSAAYQPSSAFATAAQGAKADTAVQPGSLGTAAYEASSAFASATQGAKADTALQPSAIGTSIQAYADSASQAEMEAGTESSIRAMSPLRVAQAIAALAPTGGGGGGDWDGNITDINLDGGADIGANLADADLILVDDGASGTNRKSALSRVWTYISSKISTLSQLNAVISDATLIDTTDSRLSDSRTPTAHASSHSSGGSDSIKLDDLAAPDDNTDLNATTSKHGLMPKLGGGTTNFFRADGTWAAPDGSSWDGDITDINLDGGADIGSDLADADLILVDDDASGTNRKSALSRVWTYIQSKLANVAGGIIANYRNGVSTSVSGSLTSASHSGRVLVTSGNITIPNSSGDVGFNAVIVAGGAHTVTFNSATSPAMASGDVMTVIVQSTSVIHAVLTSASNKVTFT